MKETGLGPLQDGAIVVVIGGGPAGTATAIALRKISREIGRQIRVVIVEEKHFSDEQHHNLCAGVLSPPVARLIEHDLGVAFPTHLSQNTITGYVLHASRRKIILDGEDEPSIALRRVRFDDYMMEAARQQGVEIMPARVIDLEFHADDIVVYTNSIPLQADLVVGAFGMDEGTGAYFQHAVGYRPPPALSSIVTKYHPGEQGMQDFGLRVHAFLPGNPRLEFCGITPKSNHLTINIAGASVDSSLMEAFMNIPEVRNTLPCLENAKRFDDRDLRYFKGRFPRGLAHNYVGDRYVLVGDAAGLVRAFKGKGVTSAIQTGIRAAQVVLQHGISGSAFQAYKQANHDIISDFPYGKTMRFFTLLASNTGFMNVILQASEKDNLLRQALFNAVSGRSSYREIVHESLTFNSVRQISLALAHLAFRGAPA